MPMWTICGERESYPPGMLRASSRITLSLTLTEDFVSLIGKVVTSGYGRTAAKLRSYLHAAYALGIRSKTDPAAPQAMREFAIKVNPITGIDARAQYNK